MSDYPFTEKRIGEKLFLREFKENVDSEELVWHQDQEDRIVKVIQSNGWKLQMDNEFPVTLKEGSKYFIPKMTYHRLVKGNGDLRIMLTKLF